MLDIEEDEENDDNDDRRSTKDLVASELEEALRITEDLARKARKVAGKHHIVEWSGFERISSKQVGLSFFQGEHQGGWREEKEAKKAGRQLNLGQSSEKVSILTHNRV